MMIGEEVPLQSLTITAESLSTIIFNQPLLTARYFLQFNLTKSETGGCEISFLIKERVLAINLNLKSFSKLFNLEFTLQSHIYNNNNNEKAYFALSSKNTK